MKTNTLPILYTGPQYRIVRKEAGMSINLLAKQTNVSRTQIYQFEAGTLNITISTYRRLLEALAQFKGQEDTK